MNPHVLECFTIGTLRVINYSQFNCIDRPYKNTCYVELNVFTMKLWVGILIEVEDNIAVCCIVYGLADTEYLIDVFFCLSFDKNDRRKMHAFHLPYTTFNDR